MYDYRAVGADGMSVSGSLRAPSADAAAAKLREEGLWVLGIQAGRNFGFSRQGGRMMPVAQQALGLRMLADFLESGLPLARALAALESTATPSWKIALPSVQAAIREGRSLAAALEHAPVRLSPMTLGVIRAGEAGTGLAAAVHAAAELAEQTAATRSAIREALAYPVVLATAGSISIALLVGVVLPRFARILSDLGQSLPMSTRFVLTFAAAVRALAPAGMVLTAAMVVSWRFWTGTSSGLRAWHTFLLGAPLIGTIRRSASVSRSCGALAALLATGLPIAPALNHAASASGDASLGARLQQVRQAVVRGERLSAALEAHEAATPTVTRLSRAGEESGRLAAMLAHAARLEREQALTRTRTVVRLLEPMLILCFGGIVALVAAALLQALYSVRPGV